MSTITIGAVARALTLEPIEGVNRRQARKAWDKLGEIEQQIRLAVSGTADELPAWAGVTIEFDVEFVNAIHQRYSNLTTPIFTFGIEQTHVGSPVFLTAMVRGPWTIDDRDVISGCTLVVGCVNPGEALAFTGFIDCAFQGYGAPAEGGAAADE